MVVRRPRDRLQGVSMKYRILTDRPLEYAPLSKSYTGVDKLEGWAESDIQAALRTGLIEIVEQEEQNGESNSEEYSDQDSGQQRS